MTTEEALLAAVLAAPDDDLPRLVLADHYEGELGQPERAEFIRVQCELANLKSAGHGGDRPCPVIIRMHEALVRGGQANPSCPKCDNAAALEARERELWPAVGLSMREQCLPLLDNLGIEPYAVSTVGRSRCATVRRGFPEVVYCTLADWCGGECPDCDETNTACPTCCRPGTDSEPTNFVPGDGPQIVRRHPVERVVLTDREPRGPLHDAPDLYVWRVTGVPISDGADIPADITRHLAGGKTAASWQRVYYPTREDALASLSAALIAWAKSHPPN